MILYLDTSAVVKKYFKEPGSDDVIELWKKSEAVTSSAVTYAEALAAFYRKCREVPTKRTVLQRAAQRFEKDWQSMIIVELTRQLGAAVRRLIQKHPLRGFDAIHLASALLVQENLKRKYRFVCYDHALLLAAANEGLVVFPDR